MNGEVFIPAKPQSISVHKPILEKYIPLAEAYKPRDEVDLILSIKDGHVVMLDERGDVLARASDDILRHKQVCNRQDLLGYALRRAASFKQSRGVDCSVVEDGGVVKVVAHLTAYDAFLDDVMRGLVRDPETGLKLSPTQLCGQPPEGGFLQEVSKRLLGSGHLQAYEWAKEKNCLGYARGTVVKICGDYDPDLQKYHNCYAVILKVLDAYHYRVVLESLPPKRLVIRDCDVKGIVGDVLNDFIGIGAERHKKEIVPLIERALAGKVPIIPRPCSFWPRPPVQQAVVDVHVRYGGFSRRNVEKAIRDAEKFLETIERLRETDRFYCVEDYRYARGIHTLRLKLYRIILDELDRLERGEDAVKLSVLYRDRGEVVQSLVYAGIPHLSVKDGFIIPRKFFQMNRWFSNV